MKAIPKSPIEFMDRLKMSIGDERGNLKLLKEKFQDVQPMKSGSLAVKTTTAFGIKLTLQEAVLGCLGKNQRDS